MKQIDCRIADVPCRIGIEKKNLFFDTWFWKIDPYKADFQESPLLSVFMEKTPQTCLINQDAYKLLDEESSGFLLRQVFRLPDETIDQTDQDGQDSAKYNGTIWQLIRQVNQEVYLRYFVSSDWKQIELLMDRTETAGQMAFEYLGQMMPSVMLANNKLTFHGVLLEYQGHGIIISADSGVGKTTHARLWRDEKNALILNGDRVTCACEDGIWYGYSLPWSGTSGEQINRRVRIDAFVKLERGQSNETEEVSMMEAFPLVWQFVQRPSWDQDLSEKALELVDDFLGKIAVIRLTCRPDFGAVQALEERLYSLKILED